MEFNPIEIYKEAVKAVPQIRYAMAVAAVVATAMIAYTLSRDNPVKAVLGFVLVLAGMYLLLVFARNVGNRTETYKGPITLIVWTLTLLFLAGLLTSFSALAFGWPENLAKLLGAPPLDAREAELKSRVPIPSASPDETSPSEIVEEFLQISDSSEDCGINRSRTVEYCLSTGGKVLDFTGPAISSQNCGSTISNVHRISGRENCIAADVLLRGCGYNSVLGIRNCRGRGWIVGSIAVKGER